jgi:anti-sigma-K factor RskA
MTHETFREMVPLYVIGALDGDELYHFERYVAENRELCQAEIAEYQAIADQMVLAVPYAQPSTTVYNRILTAIEEKKRPVETPTPVEMPAPTPILAPAPVAPPTRVPVRVPIAAPVSVPAPAAAPAPAPAPTVERREREGFNFGLLILRGLPWVATAVLAVLLFGANGQLHQTMRLLQSTTDSYNSLLAQSNEQQGGLTNLTVRLDTQAKQYAAQTQQLQEQIDKLRVENAEQQQGLKTLAATNKELDIEKGQLQNAADRMREQLEQQIQQTALLLKKINEQTASLDLLMDPTIRIAPLADPKGEAKAAARVYWQGEKKTGLMVVSNLTPVIEGQGKCLEIWAICGTEPPVPAGIGWTDESGHGSLRVKPAKEIACIDKFAVTVENAGGVSTPEGSIILIGQ